MKPKTILWDVDGVLADFIYGFTSTAGKLSDPPFAAWGTKVHESGDFGKIIPDNELQQRAWYELTHTNHWWSRLPTLLSTQEQMEFHKFTKDMSYRSVFCTARPDSTPEIQFQTQLFLENLGVYMPNVVVSKRKGDVARAIEADYAIDDKPENCACIHWISDVKPTKSYILDYPLINRQKILPPKVRRVSSITEFIDDIRNGR